MTFTELTQSIDVQLAKLEGSVALSVKFLSSSEQLATNSNTQFWAASVIKIPIACTFFHQVGNGLINKDTRTTIMHENLVQGTGVVKILDRETEFTYLDLVKLMLSLSDNAATNQIVDVIGWESVEKYMQELGLKNTTFRHKMMITAGRGPNLTTSSDIQYLLEKLNTNQIAGSKDIIDILCHQYDRTRIPLLLPNDVEIAHKLGSLPEAMHDVGIIYSPNPFIFVFLSDDQKDKRITNGVLANCAKLCYEYSLL